MEEWDALDADTKFYRTNEDIFKEPCIKFNNLYAAKRIGEIKELLASTEEVELKAEL